MATQTQPQAAERAQMKPGVAAGVEQISQRLFNLWSPNVNQQEAERVCHELIDPNCKIINFAPDGAVLTGPLGLLAYWKATHEACPGELQMSNACMRVSFL